MPIYEFPDPKDANPDGIVAIGGDLHPESLLLAYRSGIFPWPDPGFPYLIWACPEERGVLRFEDLHIPKSLQKERKKTALEFKINSAFNTVIDRCAQMPRPGQPGTWITHDMIEAYKTFHTLGYAHSVEAWLDGKLVAGLYGVAIDGVFAGESMFTDVPNGSKLCLLFLIEHLKQKGVTWIDIQMVTPHLQALGASTIPREAFLNLLEQAKRPNALLF